MKKVPTWVLLILVNGIVMISGFAFFIGETVYELKNTAVNQTFENLRIFSISISNIIENFADNNSHKAYDVWVKDIDTLIKNFAQQNKKFRISLIARNGAIIAESDVDSDDIAEIENQKDKEEVEEAFKGKDATAIRESSIADMVVFYYAHPVTLNNQQYVLRLSVPQTTSIYFTTDIKNMLILTGCVILCFVLLFTSIICFNVIKGIKELEKASIEYKNGNFEYNPETESTKEISDLSKSFVNMAQSIKADKEKVLRLEKIRKDFVANVSHELKTPITSIKGFAETLLDGAIDDKETAINFVNIINNESGRLFTIIEDLLDLSRLEQENENISSVEMNLVPFLQGICKKYDIKIVSESEEFVACINPSLFVQAVNNLIENALKYGGKKSEIECVLGNDKTIAIQDRGPGIPPETRDRIFERFYRIDKGRSRATGGTGLGLSIVRHIVNLHGFSIKETGRLDGKSGCRFVIYLANPS